MERRNFIVTAVGVAGMGLASTAFGMDTNNNGSGGADCPAPQEAQLIFGADIQRNHGHDLSLKTEDVVLLLRETEKHKDVEVDIQGKSGHPHNLLLVGSDLIQLLANGELTVDSTVDAGHAHTVKLTLAEAVTPVDPVPAN